MGGRQRVEEDREDREPEERVGGKEGECNK